MPTSPLVGAATIISRINPAEARPPDTSGLMGRTLLHFDRTNNRMAITKDKKREILAKITDALKEATAVAFVGFSKLSVADASKLRKDLAQDGVRYYVAKKTLIRKAIVDGGYKGEVPELPGEVAMAWTSDDVTAPARSIYDYSKKLKGAVTLLGGIFEGALTDKEKMTAVAVIPPMPVLRGMFVNVINSPIQGFVVALDKIREQKAA